MPTKRTRIQRRHKKQIRKRMTKKHKQKQVQKKGVSLKIAAPLLLNNTAFSPVSSPGTPNENSPITKRAKELAALYPNQRAMLRRSTSFNNTGMSNEEFYERLGKEIGFENKPYFPEDHLTERYR